jgi:hypothetical protein
VKGILRLMSMGLLLVAVAVAVSACQIGPLHIVNGSGNLQTERRTVRDFNEVEVRGDGVLVIEQGSTEALTIEAEDNILPHLTSDVRDGRLVLGKEEDTTLRATKPIRYRLTVKDLRAMRVSGAASVEAATFRADRLTIDISGSGDVAIGQLTVAALTVEVSGSGNLDLAGTATAQDITISGSSDYRAEDLASKTATVVVSGSGNATVRVSDTLTARVGGSGDIAYIGTPRVSEKVSGSGEIKQQAER